jgi:hypothetical protein
MKRCPEFGGQVYRERIRASGVAATSPLIRWMLVRFKWTHPTLNNQSPITHHLKGSALRAQPMRSSIMNFRSQRNATSCESANTATYQLIFFVKQLTLRLNAATVISSHCCRGPNLPGRHGAQEFNLKTGSKHEDILNQRVGCKKGRVVQGFKVDHPMHGSSSMVKVIANHDSNLSRTLSNRQLRQEERIDRGMRIHSLKLTVMGQQNRILRHFGHTHRGGGPVSLRS